jgi:hypothetical protein
MAKPYWRIKKNKKWTWIAAKVIGKWGKHPIIERLEEEE